MIFDDTNLKNELTETWDLHKTHILYQHKDFINQFILDNAGYFDYEDTQPIGDLIDATANYMNSKQNNQIMNMFYNTQDTKKKKSTVVLDSVTGHLLALQKELNSIPMNGEKTQTMLNLIDECLGNMGKLIPHKKSYTANVEKIRCCLNKNKLPLEEVKKYISYFQKTKRLGVLVSS